ncbi:MAG: efflux RND transporter permease subunit [Candidatus Obscuribacter sp.]|nr:efflux RND transporter permease subunit [Candidatus Obscuribacter sp.]
MALSLSVGFVVDDAIVMLENIVRHMEMGKTSMQAALDGAKEIGFTIVSMTISLVAVFIPVLFLPGVVGKLFNEFAVTISAAILISGVIALSFSPMRLQPSNVKHKPGAPGSDGYGDKDQSNAVSRISFDKLSDAYRWSLDWLSGHKPVVMMVFAGVLEVTLAYCLLLSPKALCLRRTPVKL